MKQLPTTPVRRGPKPNAQSRELLISAGLRKFHMAGYTATGIKEIVDAAHMPKGSFYNYFDSKEAFVLAVLERYFEDNLTEFKRFTEDTSFTPLQRLKSYFEKKSNDLSQHGFVCGCMLGNLSLEMGDHSPLIREYLSRSFGIWSQIIGACISSAQQSGEMKNRLLSLALAQFVLNSWEGALLRARVEKNEAPLEGFIVIVFEELLV